LVSADFEVLTETQVDAAVSDKKPEKAEPEVRLCACGCGEKVTGSRTLRRGHTLAPGLTAQWDTEDLLVIQTAICMMVMALTAAVESSRFNVPAMKLEEAQAFANPAGRIFARHFSWRKALPGDVADVFAMGSALTAYVVRIYVARNENATNGPDANLTISGQDTLSQYAFHPTTQPQNGATAQSNL